MRKAFAWISEDAVLSRNSLHYQAMQYWIEHYPIGYSDVARLFGIRHRIYMIAPLWQDVRERDGEQRLRNACGLLISTV